MESVQSVNSNIGKKWTKDEEQALLDELQTLDIETIASKHNRTVGGIHARCNKIAYEMHLQNISIDDIIHKTKINSYTIKQIIDKQTTAPVIVKRDVIETPIQLLTNKINTMQDTLNKLTEMVEKINIKLAEL